MNIAINDKINIFEWCIFLRCMNIEKMMLARIDMTIPKVEI